MVMDNGVLQTERMEMMSNAMIVRSLCSPGAFERILRMRDSLVPDSDIRANDLAVGFGLMAQPALHGILDRVIRFPELLDIEGDEVLRRWWKVVQGEDGTTLEALIGGTGTEMERIAGGVDDLIASIRRSGVSWEKLAEVSVDANRLAHELLAIAREGRVAVLSGDPDTDSADRLLQLSTIRHLRDYWVQGPDSHTFRYCRGRPTRWEQITPPGDSMFDIQSHRDLMHQFPGIDERDFEAGWLIGKLAAVTVSLGQMDLWVDTLPDPEALLRESGETDSVWETGNAIFEAVEKQHSEEYEFVLEVPPSLPVPVLASLTAPQSRISAVDRLTALLGKSAILISSRDPSARPHVETIVSGLACTHRDSRPIEIIRVFHGPVSDGVSLAVLMPAVGVLSDASRWWVFHHTYRAMASDVESSDHFARLDEIAENLGGSIRYRDLVDVPAEHLLDLCGSRQFRYLAEQVREQEKIASAIRGVFPELLSIPLLSHAGYEFVRTSVEVVLAGLGEREFDAVGVQSATHGGDCRIIEVKGGRAYRHDLTQEVKRFDAALKAIGQDRAHFADSLGWTEEISTVSGVFVGMARSVDIPEELRRLDVEIWDLDRFEEELRRAKLPESRIDLLEESLEVWETGGLDF